MMLNHDLVLTALNPYLTEDKDDFKNSRFNRILNKFLDKRIAKWVWTAVKDRRYDADFTNKDFHRSQILYCGGRRYVPPAGSLFFGIALKNKYSDTTWFSHEADSWVVAYHGTNSYNAQGILLKGFSKKKSKRDIYAHRFDSTKKTGIYAAADPKTALDFAVKFDHNGESYRLVIQVQVRPSAIQLIPHVETSCGDYYRIEDERDIRPCGICIFKDGDLDDYDYICNSQPKEEVRVLLLRCPLASQSRHSNKIRKPSTISMNDSINSGKRNLPYISS